MARAPLNSTVSKLESPMRSVLAIVAAVVLASACTSAPAQRLPTQMEYEQVHPKLRKLLRLNPGYSVASCGSLIFAGPIKRNSELDNVEIADGPANYYDNRSGRRIAACDYWTCSRNNSYCNRSCPPREWKCTSHIP
jgi:hypothetical protein